MSSELRLLAAWEPRDGFLAGAEQLHTRALPLLGGVSLQGQAGTAAPLGTVCAMQ